MSNSVEYLGSLFFLRRYFYFVLLIDSTSAQIFIVAGWNAIDWVAQLVLNAE